MGFRAMGSWQVQSEGAGVQGLGLILQGLRLRLQGLGLRLQGLGLRLQGLGLRLQGLRVSEVWGLGFRACSLKFLKVCGVTYGLG